MQPIVPIHLHAPDQAVHDHFLCLYGLGKIYAVEHLDLIASALEKGPDLPQHTALGVSTT